MIIIIIIRNLYSAIMPLGGYRGAGVATKALLCEWLRTLTLIINPVLEAVRVIIRQI